MKISIIAPGSLGDVLPFIALGSGLMNAGYAVNIITHKVFKDLVQNNGLIFSPLSGNPFQIINQPNESWLEEYNNPLNFINGLFNAMTPLMHDVLVDSYESSKNADLILSSEFGLFFAYNICEKLNIPLVQTYLKPINRTRAFFNALIPKSLPINNQYINYCSHLIFEKLFWSYSKSTINDLRQNILGLPKVPRKGPFPILAENKVPVLYGYSPSIIPKPSDWGNHINITGYWFLKHNRNWKPDPSLLSYIDSGPPPIFFGLGSLDFGITKGIKNIIYEFGNNQPYRMIIQSKSLDKSKINANKIYLCSEFVPHDWLFPKMSILIHHGGAGTTGQALSSGIPSIVLPFTADQPFWGDLIYKLGVGPKPVPIKKIDYKGLSNLIIFSINNQFFYDNANNIQKNIQHEKGINSAVKIIEMLLNSRNLSSLII